MVDLKHSVRVSREAAPNGERGPTRKAEAMTPDADAATVAPADLSGGGLRELGGPEAIGRDWRRFWRLLWRMTRMDWANRYQGSVLGYAWTLLGPLLYSVVLYFAFSRVLRFGGDVQDYQAVLILDIMLFSALTGCDQPRAGLLHLPQRADPPDRDPASGASARRRGDGDDHPLLQPRRRARDRARDRRRSRR